jgi:hypothetical protein
MPWLLEFLQEALGQQARCLSTRPFRKAVEASKAREDQTISKFRRKTERFRHFPLILVNLLSRSLPLYQGRQALGRQ